MQGTTARQGDGSVDVGKAGGMKESGIAVSFLSYYTARDIGTHYVLAKGAHEGLAGTYTVSVEEVL